MIIIRFMCKDGCLNIKFNGNSVESTWLETMRDELLVFMKSYFNIPGCNIKFVMWSTDANGDDITFSVNTNVEKSTDELNEVLYRQFKGNELFHITQKDIDNFTWNNNDYWIKLIDDIEEDMGRWLYPILEAVKVQERAE